MEIRKMFNSCPKPRKGRTQTIEGESISVRQSSFKSNCFPRASCRRDTCLFRWKIVGCNNTCHKDKISRVTVCRKCRKQQISNAINNKELTNYGYVGKTSIKPISDK